MNKQTLNSLNKSILKLYLLHPFRICTEQRLFGTMRLCSVTSLARTDSFFCNMEKWILLQCQGYFKPFVRDPLGNNLTQLGFSKADRTVILLNESLIEQRFGADVATENWAPLTVYLKRHCVCYHSGTLLFASSYVQSPLNRKRSAIMALSGQSLIRSGPLRTRASVVRPLSQRHVVPNPTTPQKCV